MSDAEEYRALAKIRLMLPRTESNGASPNEADAAARQIGRLIMKFPNLLNGSNADFNTPTMPRPKPKPQTKSTKEVLFRHSGIVARTDKAILVSIRGNETWVPLSQIISFDDYYISMPEWLAKEKGFE